MLFPYRYVPHKIEKMQAFIDFMFFEVWCNAPIGQEFHPDLFRENPELQAVMSELGFSTSGSERGKQFYRDVKEIYLEFRPLTSTQVFQLKKWYWGNNDMKKVCENNPHASLVRYADVDMRFPTLGGKLKSFFMGLYDGRLLQLKVIRELVGEIDDHYNELAKANDFNSCPYCGLESLSGEYNSKREAYDHYLPKAIYPFNSVNLKNLVPACHHCNSSYKGVKDLAYVFKDPCGTSVRRKMFYPYATSEYKIKVEVVLKHAGYQKLTPTDIELKFDPPELAEQIGAWKEVYGIEERYRAKLCSRDAKDWLEQVLTAKRKHDRTNGLRGALPYHYLEDVAEHAEASPYANCNFLKSEFLQACNHVGVFDRIDDDAAQVA